LQPGHLASGRKHDLPNFAKAGVEDASRGVITSLDWIVVVLDPSYAGIRAAATMKTMLDQMRAGCLPATQHLASPEQADVIRRAYREARTKGALYVLNKVPDAQTERLMRQRLLESQIEALASIREDSELRRSWLQGECLQSAAAEAEGVKIVRALEQQCRAIESQQSIPLDRPNEAFAPQAV